jgi:hypothetical protein
MSNGIESVIKCFSGMKDFTARFYQTFKEYLKIFANLKNWDNSS